MYGPVSWKDAHSRPGRADRTTGTGFVGAVAGGAGVGVRSAGEAPPKKDPARRPRKLTRIRCVPPVTGAPPGA